MSERGTATRDSGETEALSAHWPKLSNQALCLVHLSEIFSSEDNFQNYLKAPQNSFSSREVVSLSRDNIQGSPRQN